MRLWHPIIKESKTLVSMKTPKISLKIPRPHKMEKFLITFLIFQVSAWN
jgi:hypothetical protein